MFEVFGTTSDMPMKVVMDFLTPPPFVSFCFAERLAAAKEENIKIHATLDATLQDLNNF